MLARQFDTEQRQNHDKYDGGGAQGDDQSRMPRFAQRLESRPNPEDNEAGGRCRADDHHRRQERHALERQLERPRHDEHEGADDGP